MRTIFINGRYLTQNVTGVQRFAAEVVRALDTLLHANELTFDGELCLVTPEGHHPLPSLNRIKIVQHGTRSGHLWEQLDLPRLAHAGLLFNPCGPSPIFHPCQVTVLHDASVFLAPQGYSWAYRTWTRLLYLSSGIRARQVLTVSHYSRRQLLEHCKTLAADRVSVVSPGSDHVLHWRCDDEILLKRLGPGTKPYVLCVGSQQANKNIGIVASLAPWLHARGIETVITGGTANAVFRSEAVASDQIVRTGYVSDAMLNSLYRNAQCFVFPSFEEGFGIPPLEAMRCACPVIVSSSASMPEVCGDAAEYFDPRDPQDLKRALCSVLDDAARSSELKRLGLHHAQEFTWQRTARSVWEHLQAVLSHSRLSRK